MFVTQQWLTAIVSKNQSDAPWESFACLEPSLGDPRYSPSPTGPSSFQSHLLLSLIPILICTLLPIWCWILQVPEQDNSSMQQFLSPQAPSHSSYKEAALYLELIQGCVAESCSRKISTICHDVWKHAPPHSSSNSLILKGCLDSQSPLGSVECPLGVLKQVAPLML